MPLAVCAVIALGITYGMYRYTLNLMKDEIGQRLMSIAATAAPEIDAKDLEPLRLARDMEKEEYQRVFRKLNEIRERNEDVVYVYILRPTEEFAMWEFVADADTNYDWLEYSPEDQEDVSPPGMRYYLLPYSPELASVGMEKPTYEPDFIFDQWGVFLAGGAPIYDESGTAVAALGIDMRVEESF